MIIQARLLVYNRDEGIAIDITEYWILHRYELVSSLLTPIHLYTCTYSS